MRDRLQYAIKRGPGPILVETMTDWAFAERLERVPPYLFVEIDRLKREAIAKGADIIDFGVGDPDQPTPWEIIEELYRAAQDPKTHRYALDGGLPQFKQAIAAWYRRRFHVTLDPETEILPLIGSKEGIAHLPLAFINPGDAALVPDPCYPPTRNGTILAGGEPIVMPLREANGFVPDLRAISSAEVGRAKVMFLNYPNNPTAATVSAAWLREAVAFAREHRLILCYDNAYSELTFDGYQAPSVLQVEGAKEVAVEFHSLSKNCNMTGWRVGWAAGHAQAIAGLLQVKSNVDSGVFTAIQWAGVKALEILDHHLPKMRQVYQERRDLLVAGLRRRGWEVATPKATFYLWVKTPRGQSSAEAAKGLLERSQMVVTPGHGFGPSGEGYLRFALTVPKERIQQALERLAS